MAKVRPIKRTFADIPLSLQPAVARERADFEHVYRVLVAAFELQKPDARARAKDVHRAYVAVLRQLREVREQRRPQLLGDFVGPMPEGKPRPRRPFVGPMPAKSLSKRQRATLILIEDRLARLGDLLNRARGRKSTAHDTGPTPETVVQQDRATDEASSYAKGPEGFNGRSRGDSLNRLASNGVIDRDEMKAGRQIASIFEAVTRGMGAKAGSLQRGLGGGTWRLSDRLAVLHQDRYRPWAQAALQRIGAPALMMSIAVVVDGESLRRAARRQRIGYARAKRLIKTALRLYAIETQRTRYAEDAEYLAERIGAEDLALLESGILPGAKP